MNLQRLSCGRRTHVWLVLRAKVIFAADEGNTNKWIAEQAGTDPGLVGRCRRLFAAGSWPGSRKMLREVSTGDRSPVG